MLSNCRPRRFTGHPSSAVERRRLRQKRTPAGEPQQGTSARTRTQIKASVAAFAVILRRRAGVGRRKLRRSASALDIGRDFDPLVADFMVRPAKSAGRNSALRLWVRRHEGRRRCSPDRCPGYRRIVGHLPGPSRGQRNKSAPEASFTGGQISRIGLPIGLQISVAVRARFRRRPPRHPARGGGLLKPYMMTVHAANRAAALAQVFRDHLIGGCAVGADNEHG